MLELSKLSRPDAILLQKGLKASGEYNGTTRGLPGPKTAAAYARYLSNYGLDQVSFAERFARVAESQIGVHEVGGNNRGPDIDKYESATWLDPSKDWAWCASFLCWCICEAAQDEPVDWRRPRTAGAWDFERWAREQKHRGIRLIKPTPKNVKRGDILVFKMSHIGMARHDSKGGKVRTIEGNTGAQGQRDGDVVASKLRSLSKIRSVIRFP